MLRIKEVMRRCRREAALRIKEAMRRCRREAALRIKEAMGREGIIKSRYSFFFNPCYNNIIQKQANVCLIIFRFVMELHLRQ